MKTPIALLVLTWALLGCAHPPVKVDDRTFFPVGTFRVSSDRGDTDSHQRNWYSKHLRAMSEPSLSSGNYTGDVYRFLWLRTWGRPIVVRVESDAHAWLLTAVELDG